MPVISISADDLTRILKARQSDEGWEFSFDGRGLDGKSRFLKLTGNPKQQGIDFQMKDGDFKTNGTIYSSLKGAQYLVDWLNGRTKASSVQ